MPGLSTGQILRGEVNKQYKRHLRVTSIQIQGEKEVRERNREAEEQRH